MSALNWVNLFWDSHSSLSLSPHSPLVPRLDLLGRLGPLGLLQQLRQVLRHCVWEALDRLQRIQIEDGRKEKTERGRVRPGTRFSELEDTGERFRFLIEKYPNPMSGVKIDGGTQTDIIKILSLYRVTIQVDSNLPLTPKQMLRSSISSSY